MTGPNPTSQEAAILETKAIKSRRYVMVRIACDGCGAPQVSEARCCGPKAGRLQVGLESMLGGEGNSTMVEEGQRKNQDSPDGVNKPGNGHPCVPRSSEPHLGPDPDLEGEQRRVAEDLPAAHVARPLPGKLPAEHLAAVDGLAIPAQQDVP